MQPRLRLNALSDIGAAQTAVFVIVAVAWALSLAAGLGGGASVLHHHALIEGGPPLWFAIPSFLAAWLVMVAAMMVPTALPALQATVELAASTGRSASALCWFLLAYAAVWVSFGFFAFLGDVVLHHAVDATPWLQTRPRLITAEVFAIAGAFQLSPLKTRWLGACRRPHPRLDSSRWARRVGLEQGLACLGSSWALMLVMFGAGVANIGWMVLLTVLMAYETVGRFGELAARVAGAALLALTVVLLLDPLDLPGWLLV
jgi:predicted metal-binding membrane protein